MKILRAAPLAILALAAPALADRPSCVRWWAQTVAAGLGYNHVVGIEKRCDRPATCVVSTDVAPDPIQATVSPKQKVELVTFRGSPSRVFKAKVECKLQ